MQLEKNFTRQFVCSVEMEFKGTRLTGDVLVVNFAVCANRKLYKYNLVELRLFSLPKNTRKYIKLKNSKKVRFVSKL